MLAVYEPAALAWQAERVSREDHGFTVVVLLVGEPCGVGVGWDGVLLDVLGEFVEPFCEASAVFYVACVVAVVHVGHVVAERELERLLLSPADAWHYFCFHSSQAMTCCIMAPALVNVAPQSHEKSSRASSS